MCVRYSFILLACREVIFVTNCETELLCPSGLLYFHCNLLILLLKLHQVLVQLQSGDKEQDFSLAPIQVSISVQLWRLPGCHEFLAALGKT